VVVLHPAEAMNQNAANALLKSLEEPTAETYLLLISDQPSRLLPTIRSRCRVQPLGLPGLQQARDWLGAELPDVDDNQRTLLLQMAMGAPLRALDLHQQGAVAHREKVVEGVKALLKGQISAPRLAEQWNSIALDLLLDWFAAWTLELLKLNQGAQEAASSADMDKVLGYLLGIADSGKRAARLAGLAVAAPSAIRQQGQPQSPAVPRKAACALENAGRKTLIWRPSR